MATISSNSLALYALDTGSTDPLEVSDTDPTGASTGDYYIKIDANGDFDSIQKFSSSSWGAAPSSDLKIVTFATSTTLDISNTINEVVARDGTGGSSAFIASGANSWTMSVDGLLDVNASQEGSAITIMDASRAGYYLIGSFYINANLSYIGQAIIESNSITGGVDEIATYSASLQGYGKLYKKTA